MSNESSERKRNKEKNKLLIAEVKKQQAIYGWTYEEMEKKIGVPKSTISAFMCGARDGNEVRQALTAFTEALDKEDSGQ